VSSSAGPVPVPTDISQVTDSLAAVLFDMDGTLVDSEPVWDEALEELARWLGGALSPAAVAIIAPIALTFAARHGISPLLMGMMVIHGAQGGGFSPISVYGVTVNTIVEDEGLPSSPLAVFLGALFFNLAIAMVLFLVLGGALSLAERRHRRDTSA